MVIVRRLLGLNAEAGSEDIRAFFHGLHIPEGGVHIIGGRRGEAFIIFNTERDGQLAMQHSGQLLRGSVVTLHGSSVAEFKHKMESRLRKRKRSAMEKKLQVEVKKVKKEKVLEEVNKQAEPQAATDLGTALILGIMAAFQGMQSNSEEKHTPLLPASTPQLLSSPQDYPSENPSIPHMDQTYPIYSKVQENDTQRLSGNHSEHDKWKGTTKTHKQGYLRLYGLPDTVTKKTVGRFFEGLSVLEVIPNVFLGRDKCCLVKVASLEDAEKGLKYSHMYLGDCCIEVRTANERMWKHAVDLYKREKCSIFPELDRISPNRHSSWTPPVKRLSEDRSLSGSPKRCHFDSLPTGKEYCVMVNNLSPKTTKSKIKEIFSCTHIPNHDVIHLLNKWGQRTSTAFIIFLHAEDYASAMNMDGCLYGTKLLEVSSITKEKMRDLMYKEKYKETESSAYEAQVAPSYIYARNFPGDVRKREVKDFFCLYHISEDDITLLKDDHGNGIGEAIIQFRCKQVAREARGLHGGIFLGHKIMLTCISPEQMKSILQETH